MYCILVYDDKIKSNYYVLNSDGNIKLFIDTYEANEYIENNNLLDTIIKSIFDVIL